MKLFGVTGPSGAGKTTLLLKVIPLLAARGLKVSTIKQARAGFDVDVPGKDSYEHRAAGARGVLVASAKRWALMHEYRDEPESTQEQLLARMSPADLVLVEGFRTWPHKRLEVYRPKLGKAPLFPSDPLVVAVAADGPVPGWTGTLLPLDDAEAIATFVWNEVSR